MTSYSPTVRLVTSALHYYIWYMYLYSKIGLETNVMLSFSYLLFLYLSEFIHKCVYVYCCIGNRYHSFTTDAILTIVFIEVVATTVTCCCCYSFVFKLKVNIKYDLQTKNYALRSFENICLNNSFSPLF